MGNRPHIVQVTLPDLSAMALEGGLAAAVESAAGGTTDVIVEFFGGAIYQYSDVPVPLAFAVQSDPEGAFPNIRYWPGYRRIR